MTADRFRTLALSLPEVTESYHVDHPDFRVGKRIFATLGYPDKKWGMLALTPPEQRVFVAAYPKVFAPVKGAWGSKGATNVRLQFATQDTVWPAMIKAWKTKANKTLVNEHPNLSAGAD